MRILIACDTLVASGGLLRFERLAHALGERGHTFSYLTYSAAPPEFPTALDVLTLAEASILRWDAVLAPGAGFPGATIDAFERLRTPNFGVRIQMVLNDRTVRDRFLQLNARFHPDIVIFNSQDWHPGTYRDFRGNRFHHLIGAVDLRLFKPATNRAKNEHFVIGAQIAKSPQLIAAMLRHLPSDFAIHYFGMDRGNAWPRLSAEFGDRVRFSGPLFGPALSNFYQNVDCVISAEKHAGWANIVAESMASARPVVTTPAGVLSLAMHESTALIVQEPQPELLAQNVMRLRGDEHLRQRLVRAALDHVRNFDWPTYAEGFLKIVRNYDGRAHYSYAPELGLYGKTTWSERRAVLNPLFALRPLTVLDVGAAEGLVSRAFQDAGAKQIHAYEKDPGRVLIGQDLLRDGATLSILDLTAAGALAVISARAPADGYDLVLYLGVHHHLPPVAAPQIVRALFALAKGRLALRTTQAAFDRDSLSILATGQGFELESAHDPGPGAFSGPLWVFRRTDSA